MVRLRRVRSADQPYYGNRWVSGGGPQHVHIGGSSMVRSDDELVRVAGGCPPTGDVHEQVPPPHVLLPSSFRLLRRRALGEA